jgi:uncharacterized protein (TIGR03032 family)
VVQAAVEAVQSKNAVDVDNFDFSSSSTDSFLTFLQTYGISLAVTSYDGHRLVVLRQVDGELDTLLVPVARPRGLAVSGNKLTVSSFTELINFYRSGVQSVPEEFAEGADVLYLPRNVHVTGQINVHDVGWGPEGLWLVNSRFSCLCTLQPDLSFKARWWPFYLNGPSHDGAGHLNCMALDGGKPAYVTCFGPFSTHISWRDQQDLHTGLLIDVEQNKAVLSGLYMPHSPTMFQNKVYVCNSGYGTVLCYDPATGQSQQVIQLPGFTRGLVFYRHYMLVCCSRHRDSSVKSVMPLGELYPDTVAGIYIVDTTNFSVVAFLQFDGDVTQLYDIVVLENTVRPQVLGLQDPRLKDVFVFNQG